MTKDQILKAVLAMSPEELFARSITRAYCFATWCEKEGC